MKINIKKLLYQKICSKCKEYKDFDCFTKNKTWCKECRKIDNQLRLVRNGGKIRLSRDTGNNNTKICTKCLIERNNTEFSNYSWCKFCIKIQNRKYADLKNIKEKFIPYFDNEKKQCCKCKEIKLLIEYSPSKRGRLGKSAYCKKCNSENVINRLTSEERKTKTQLYRDNNREWWRQLHRINQFNRRNNIKKLTDNTITKEFIISLYNTEKCYYCNKIIEREKRTCDHKIPLNKEGVHGISNLVMACISCNATKRDMTEDEFLNYKIKQNENRS